MIRPILNEKESICLSFKFEIKKDERLVFQLFAHPNKGRSFAWIARMLSNKATDNGLFESGILSLKETDASKRRPMIGLLVFSESKASNPSPWSIGLRLIRDVEISLYLHKN